MQGVRDQMASGLIVWVKVAAETDKAVELLKTRTEVAEIAAPVDGRIKVTMVWTTTRTIVLWRTRWCGAA